MSWQDVPVGAMPIGVGKMHLSRYYIGPSALAEGNKQLQTHNRIIIDRLGGHN